MTFDFDHKTYNVIKTKHVMESRVNARIERSRFVSDRLLLEVFKFSFSRGLTSFRDKGQIVLMFFNDRGVQTSLLIELEGYKITLISVYYEKRPGFLKYNFVKVRNRIYLNKVFTSLSKDEVQENRKSKSMYEIEKECASEDYLFTKYIRKSGTK